jgi:CheY-like chemotaxis protein/HPt (histidine-containing phosphotransfer) domain-containing protein
MGGKLTVESVLGEGSTFRFYAAFDVSQTPQVAGEVKDFHGRKVLVLESNATNRLIYREAFTAWGLVSVEHMTAREGCTELSAALRSGTPYSMVLLDRQLPDMDGFDAIAMIHKAQPGIPIVMLTGDGRPGEATRCRAAGIVGHAVRPVRRTDLLRLVCDALGQPIVSEVRQPESAAGSLPEVMAPLRILIAEDSSDNRLLLRAYLKQTAHKLTFVEDGERAVAEFRSSQATNLGYDLVLMDIQMPLMDGLEATRVIRALEQDLRLTPTPILALTASALAHDLAASSAAGCNAHLSKPISKRKLLSEIENYGRASEAPVELDPILIEVAPDVEELAPEYLAERKREVAILRGFLELSDFDNIRILAHNMKGNGRSFGFPELTNQGGAMEHSARERDGKALERQCAELANYLDRVELKAVV